MSAILKQGRAKSDASAKAMQPKRGNQLGSPINRGMALKSAMMQKRCKSNATSDALQSCIAAHTYIECAGVQKLGRREKNTVTRTKSGRYEYAGRLLPKSYKPLETVLETLTQSEREFVESATIRREAR